MKDFDSLQNYLPSVVAKAVSEHAMRNADGSWTKPATEEIETVCLFADVSGFTALTEDLCARGPDGLETLSDTLNKFATQLVKLTTRTGGDIVKFAGDALIALWPAVDEKDTIELRVQRAVQCALEIQKRLTGMFEVPTGMEEEELVTKKGKNPKNKHYLQFKLGLGMGKVRVMHLGGHEDLIQRERYEYVVFGPALSEAITSETAAQPGEVVVSQKIWRLVGSNYVPRGKDRNGKSDLIKTLSSVVLDATKEYKRVPMRTFDRSLPHDREIERKLWKYVPNAVMPYLTEGSGATWEMWAPELRTVTTMFFDLGFNIAELNAGKHLDKLETVFYEIQGIVFGFEGTINKFLIDDKGSTLIAVFGLPPFAHENEPLRAILCALRIFSFINKYDLQGAAGIATGLAFCGIIGHATGNRREYSVIGDTVNLAARLMGASKKPDIKLLLDVPTKECVEDSTVLDFVPRKIRVKGKKDEVQTFQIGALGSKPSASAAHYSNISKLSKVVNSNKKQGAIHIRKGRGQKPVTSPAEMKLMEQSQINAMNTTEGFRESPNTRKYGSGGSGGHDAALGAAAARRSVSNMVRRASKRFSSKRLSAKGKRAPSSPPTAPRSPSRGKALAKVIFRDSTEVEAEVTVEVTKEMQSVEDLIETVVRMFIRKGHLSPSSERDMRFFELLIDYEGQITTLNPLRSLDTYVDRSGRRRLALELVRRNELHELSSSSSIHSLDYVIERLSIATNAVFANKGGRFILLDGDYGAGKTHLVESYLHSFLRERDDSDSYVAYARGNPFETGRNARPFSIWDTLVTALLPPQLQAKGKLPPKSKEEQIASALDAATKNLDHAGALGGDDLFLLNRVLMTDFIRGLGATEDSNGVRGSNVSKASTYSNGFSIFGKSSRGRNLANLKMLTPFGQSFDNLSISACDQDTKTVINLLAAIIAGFSVSRPVVLVVDQAHYIDTFSWLVFQAIAQDYSDCNILVVLLNRIVRIEAVALSDRLKGEKANQRVSFRPQDARNQLKSHLDDSAPGFNDVEAFIKMHNKLREMDNVELLELQPDARNTRNIILSTLNVERMPFSLEDYLRRKTGGNPLYIKDALRLFIKDNLIEVSMKEREISFPNKNFDDLLRKHDLPIPMRVESIVGSMIDKMTLSQVLIIKVAANAGDAEGGVFNLGTIKEAFPLRPKSASDFVDKDLDANLDVEFKQLVDAGFIEQVVHDEVIKTKTPPPPDSIPYRFSHGWMVEILRKRMLNSQKNKLTPILDALAEKIRKDVDKAFYKAAKNKITLEATLYVRKTNSHNRLSKWKQRRCKLVRNELIQYYDHEKKKEKKALEVLKLNETSSVTMHSPKTHKADSSWPDPKPEVIYTFSVEITHWEKNEKPRNDPRVFVFAASSEDECRNWVEFLSETIKELRKAAARVKTIRLNKR